MPQTEFRAVLALAVLFADPPPEVVGMYEPERNLCWTFIKLALRHSVTVTLQDNGFLVHKSREQLRVRRFIEAPQKPPWSLDDKHIFGVAVRSAGFAQLRFEDIEDCDLFPIRIANFLEREAPWNLVPDEPNPFSCDQIDSGDTPVFVLVGVGEAENPDEAHGAGLTSRM
jgi:hypothetical protein